MLSDTTLRTQQPRSGYLPKALAAGACLLLGVVLWQVMSNTGVPDTSTLGRGSIAQVVDIAILVFREGLECILVLSAITASMMKSDEGHWRPVAAGVSVGMLATLATWFVAVGIIDDLAKNLNALYIQAATGLLAIVVLLIVMNWFFHKMYWTGWISLHNKRKHDLIKGAADQSTSLRRVFFGMALLGFTSFYREGVEVVLFLQSYRLRLGGQQVLYGVILGLTFTSIVAALTFFAHRKLPYKKMLVLTGIMLGGVLLIMVGEQAQEMQLAHWLPTTPIPWLTHRIPVWMGLWFSIFPTVEALSAQAIAGVAVIGSYFIAQRK